jgi:carboxymethylenebutenolidase
MGTMIEFTRPDGKAAPGYLASTSAKDAPGVVMMSEWWGLDERIKETADRLASSGYNVLVPDFYRGRAAATGDEANHLMSGLDFGDAATQDAVGAARYLREHGARKVGITGFCMGGALAMIAVMNGNEFDSASIWYGYPPAGAGDPSKIRIPLQGHWAEHDEFFTLEGVAAIEAKLKAAGVPFEFHRYDAKHGFYNKSEAGQGGLGHHHPEHAETAWQRTVAFFNRTLELAERLL